MKKFYLAIATIVAVLGLAPSFRLAAEQAGTQSTESEHGSPEPKDDHAAKKKAGNAEHGKEIVRLSPEEMKEFGIELAVAETGSLDQQISLPGEIALNTDRTAHVVPVVAGIVREVRATLGDSVKAGDVLAVIESRELTDGKAAFLSAVEREVLAQTSFRREERLWEKKVSSEQEYLDARQALAETSIARKSAEQHLRALGFSDAELKDLREKPDTVLARFEVRAPLTGTVIEKHLTLGEHVKADAEVFTIADMSSVWADINVYQKDLINIRKGQKAVIEIGHGIPTASGTIGWIGHQVDETTRTAKARIILPNPDGSLRSGLFVTAKIAVGKAAGIAVPKSAIQPFEGKTTIFVRMEDGFTPKPVAVGQQNEISAEILSGLAAGETYVSQGAFTLKAQLSKAAFGDGHNH